MGIRLPTVKVTPVEAQAGFLVTCSACTLRAVRRYRFHADELAQDHRASHQATLHEDD